MGDTPLDVDAGHAVGARVAAVATGASPLGDASHLLPANRPTQQACERRVITTGDAVADRLEILSGLSVGDRLVLNPENRSLDPAARTLCLLHSSSVEPWPRTPGCGPRGVFSPERRHMTRVIAFFNQKGRTAKTTSTVAGG